MFPIGGHMQMMVQFINVATCGSNVKKGVEYKNHMDGHYPLRQLIFFYLTIAIYTTIAATYFFLFDDSNLHYTHAHIVWGGQRGFEPQPNGGEFSLTPLGQIPSGHHCSNLKI